MDTTPTANPAASQQYGLGICQLNGAVSGKGFCQGELCLENGKVVCMRCGQPHPEHPVQKAANQQAEMEKKSAPKEFVIDPNTYPPTPERRFTLLENAIKALQAEMAAFKTQLVRSEAQRGGKAKVA